MSKEYINRELLENALEDENKNGNFVFTANWIMEIVDNIPTADVAPKSEVAIEVLDEAIRAVYSKTDMKIYNTIEGKPLGDGVAFGRQQAMYDVITLLAELKKKYTEEKE